MAEQPAKYYFRGTTLGYSGNTSSANLPSTSTTINPVKAVIFALCYFKPGRTGVIYIADAAAVANLKRHEPNGLAGLEEETAFSLQPNDFYRHCSGFITLNNAVNILSKMNIRIYPPFDLANLSRCLREVDKISEQQIEEFMVLARELIENI